MPKRTTQLSLLGSASAESTRIAYRGAMQRAKNSKKPAIAPRPWLAVVLGVDQASKRSGWCLMVSGKYVHSGELDTFDVEAVRGVVRAALELAGDIRARLDLVRAIAHRHRERFDEVCDLRRVRGRLGRTTKPQRRAFELHQPAREDLARALADHRGQAGSADGSHRVAS